MKEQPSPIGTSFHIYSAEYMEVYIIPVQLRRHMICFAHAELYNSSIIVHHRLITDLLQASVLAVAMKEVSNGTDSIDKACSMLSISH